MKKTVSLFFLFISLAITAQNVMVVYQRTVFFGRRNYILYITDTLSYWQYVKDLEMLDTTLVIDGSKMTPSHVTNITTPEYDAYPYKDFILKDKQKKEIFYVDHSIKDPDGNVFVHAKDSLFPMKWEPIPDHQYILGYICNAAKTTFRGRTYVAYYAPELPYNDGPWKFGGLPGLILEVKDQSGEFHWEAKKIILHYQGVPDMPNLKDYHFYDWPEYVRIVRAWADRRIDKMNAYNIRNGGKDWGSTRVIKEEILHPIHSFKGVFIGEKPDDFPDEDSPSEQEEKLGTNTEKNNTSKN